MTTDLSKMNVKVLVKKNPARPGSRAFKAFNVLAKCRTAGEYITRQADRYTRQDLRVWQDRGWLELAPARRKATRKCPASSPWP